MNATTSPQTRLIPDGLSIARNSSELAFTEIICWPVEVEKSEEKEEEKISREREEEEGELEVKVESEFVLVLERALRVEAEWPLELVLGLELTPGLVADWLIAEVEGSKGVVEDASIDVCPDKESEVDTGGEFIAVNEESRWFDESANEVGVVWVERPDDDRLLRPIQLLGLAETVKTAAEDEDEAADDSRDEDKEERAGKVEEAEEVTEAAEGPE